MDRRQFLLGLTATTATLPLSRALAASGTDKKLLLIFANGGWDTTRVFSPEFGNAAVSMEPQAERFTVGNLSLVDAPDRPSVRSFFDRYHSAVSIIDGLLVPSVAHETCTRIMLTGSTRDTADWAALLAGLQADRYVLPNLVIDAPSYPAQYGIAVARSGLAGQLDGLVDGSRLEAHDQRLALPSNQAQGAIDRYLARRTAGALAGARSEREQAVLLSFQEASRRATELKEARFATTFGASSDLPGKLSVAIEALATGTSRTVSLMHPGYQGTWDTHANNDAGQTTLWEELFAGLIELQEMLERATGKSGRPLSEEVMVMVVSEMGRTPALNSASGKDHWPYTSAMLWGPGITGGRQVGGYDDGFQGRSVDLASGELSDAGVVPTASHLGATLLAAADLDPAEFLPGFGPVGALLGG